MGKSSWKATVAGSSGSAPAWRGDASRFTAPPAGTVVVLGQPGIRTGAGMKRGTIALYSGRPQLLPTFPYDCTYRPVFLSLYLRQLRAWGFPIRDEYLHGFYRRYSGDLVALGKG